MRLLHILTREDELAGELVEQQSAQSGHEVRVVDLRGPHPDYNALLDEIFQADSIHVS